MIDQHGLEEKYVGKDAPVGASLLVAVFFYTGLLTLLFWFIYLISDYSPIWLLLSIFITVVLLALAPSSIRSLRYSPKVTRVDYINPQTVRLYWIERSGAEVSNILNTEDFDSIVKR